MSVYFFQFFNVFLCDSTEVCMEENALEKLIKEDASEKLHWRSCKVEVAFGVGAESMVTSKPHSAMASTSSESISLQLESKSAPSPNLVDLA